MANDLVPLKFQIFRGDELIKEEILTETVIKVGKLASSHLRIEDESVSRMHAVIEINGAEDVQLIDLGSTRGTLVNGEKVTKTRLHNGDLINFGEVRVVITFMDAEEATVVAPAPVVSQQVSPSQYQTSPPTAPRGVPAAVAPPRPATSAPAYAAPPAATYAPPAAAPTYAPPPAAAPSYPAPAAAFPSAPAAVARPAVAAPFPSAPPAPVYAAPLAYAPGGVNPVAAEVEDHDGSRAIEVQALYRGVVINTRHMFDPSAKDTSSQAKAFIGAGIAILVVALGIFFSTVSAVAKEKARYEAYIADTSHESKGFAWTRQTGTNDALVFGGFGLGLVLCYMGLKRRGKVKPNYLIGNSEEVDAPVGSEFVAGGAHPLVAASGGDYLVNVTPQMTGEVVTDNQVMPLQQFVQQRGGSFSLPDRARAKIDCGETSFLLTSTPRPRVMDIPFFIWQWEEQIYTVGAGVALALFLLMIFSVPPDPKSLSLDLFNSDNRFVNFLIKPPEEKEEEIPEWLKKKGPEEQGGKGKRHKGEEGKMGKKTSKNKEGLYGLKGPKDNPDPHLAKKLAEENAKNAGILGVLKMTEGSHLASIFGRDNALGNDADNVLGGLVGNQIGEAYGVGGLGLVGTGSGGGGTGEGTIGLGNLGTIGKGGGGGNGSGYGRGAGGLGGRRAKSPDVNPGQATVRGSLDKEIIRRVIRRHLNEVKYCYEQELVRKADLGGRVAVNFTIKGTGDVMASVLQNSTMGNARVENCVVQAVRRWKFPSPEGGGIVVVTYPFNFTPAGGATEQ